MDVLDIGFVRNILLLFFIFVGGCESQHEKSVRLVDGPREGRVEIYFEDMWSTVSRDEWTEKEALAVCRQLGFDSPASTVEPGAADIAQNIPNLSVNCTKGASSLTECQIQKTAGLEREASIEYLDGQIYWDHSEIAGVKCENVPDDSGSRVALIVLNVVGILIVIAVISLFGTLFYRFKKRHDAKEYEQPGAGKPESMAMYSTRIEKNYAEIGEDQAQQYITIDTTQREPESSYQMPNIKDTREQTSE